MPTSNLRHINSSSSGCITLNINDGFSYKKTAAASVMELGRWIVRLSHREEFRSEGQQFVEFRRFLVYLIGQWTGASLSPLTKVFGNGSHRNCCARLTPLHICQNPSGGFWPTQASLKFRHTPLPVKCKVILKSYMREEACHSYIYYLFNFNVHFNNWIATRLEAWWERNRNDLHWVHVIS